MSNNLPSLSASELQIIDCLKKHGELELDEMASLLGVKKMELYDPIVWLMGRGLLKDRKVEGKGKHPAIAT